jgi:hypothetical protein
MNSRLLLGTLAASLMFLGLAVTACGGSQPAPPEPAPATPPPPPPPMETAEPVPSAAPEPAPVAPPPRDWHALTEDQKKEVMKSEVVPKMKELFGALDAKRFPDVKCTTCHGEGAMKGKFEMPNPKLPKLDMKNGFEKHKKKDAKIVAFMMEQVVPEMAKIIGEPVYDPATGKGFGCMECHTMVK